MKKILWLVGILVTLVSIRSFAEPRETGNFSTKLVAEDDGDSLRPFSVNVGSTTGVLVYYSTQTAAARVGNYASPDRVLVIQNPQSFVLYCSTLSSVSPVTGNRFLIMSTATGRGYNEFKTYNPPQNIYCVFDPLAGSGTKEVLGWVGYDSGD